LTAKPANSLKVIAKVLKTLLDLWRELCLKLCATPARLPRVRRRWLHPAPTPIGCSIC
jgi:hypothetical protein